MIKTREDSRIEVWSDQYINNPIHRKDEDRDMVIIGNMEHATYQINGITYDDGSNISDAISTIVKAARIGRRV